MDVEKRMLLMDDKSSCLLRQNKLNNGIKILGGNGLFGFRFWAVAKMELAIRRNNKSQPPLR